MTGGFASLPVYFAFQSHRRSLAVCTLVLWFFRSCCCWYCLGSPLTKFRCVTIVPRTLLASILIVIVLQGVLGVHVRPPRTGALRPASYSRRCRPDRRSHHVSQHQWGFGSQSVYQEIYIGQSFRKHKSENLGHVFLKRMTRFFYEVLFSVSKVTVLIVQGQRTKLYGAVFMQL